MGKSWIGVQGNDSISKNKILEMVQFLVRAVQGDDPEIGLIRQDKKKIIGDEKVKELKSQSIGWVFYANVEITKNVISVREGEEESGLSITMFIELK